MRNIAWKLLIAVGVLFGLFFVPVFFVFLTDTVMGGFVGGWGEFVFAFIFTAALGTISYFSITVGWYRLTGKQIGVPARYMRLLRVKLPRVPLTVFLLAIAAALAATAVAIAFHINRLEFNDFIAATAEAILPWDPTHTARKYLILTFVVAAGAFAWLRYGRRQRRIALLPALMLIVAVPLGAIGYEMRSNYWSYSFWIENGMDGRIELARDPYVYLGEVQAESTFAIKVRNDMVRLLRFSEMSGMSGDWSGLGELEVEVRMRRRTGFALLAAFVGLVIGAVYLVRRERNATLPQPPIDP